MKKNGWMIEAETLIENKFDERVSPISPLFEQSQNRGEQVKDNWLLVNFYYLNRLAES